MLPLWRLFVLFCPGGRCEPVARADARCVHFNSTHAEVSKTVTEAAGAPGSSMRMNLGKELAIT